MYPASPPPPTHVLVGLDVEVPALGVDGCVEHQLAAQALVSPGYQLVEDVEAALTTGPVRHSGPLQGEGLAGDRSCGR